MYRSRGPWTEAPGRSAPPAAGDERGQRALRTTGARLLIVPAAFALRVVGQRDLLRARGFYARWGGYAVATARAVGGPAEPVIVLAGMSRMRWREVLGALCLGGIPAGLLNAGLGEVAARSPLVAVAAAVLLALLATWVARRATHAADTTPGGGL